VGGLYEKIDIRTANGFPDSGNGCLRFGGKSGPVSNACTGTSTGTSTGPTASRVDIWREGFVRTGTGDSDTPRRHSSPRTKAGVG